MSSLENISTILNSFLSKKGYLSFCIENDILKKWNEIVGEEVSSISLCDHIENNTLYVRVLSSSWRNEIQFFKDDILCKINNEYNCKSIKDIVFI